MRKCKAKAQISHLLEWLLSKREEITHSDVNLEEKELLDTVGEKINRHSHNGKQYEGVPELKIPFLGMYPKE